MHCNMGVYVHACISQVHLFATPQTSAFQVPLFMEFSRQEYWSGLPFPTPGDLHDPGIEPAISCVSCIGRQILTTETLEKPITKMQRNA